MKIILCAITLMLFNIVFSQSITNGNFNTTSGWGCNPEFNPETVYGGSNSSNQVTEIDAGADLCQTISGFTVGSQYSLALRASRRTGSCPSPNPTTINVQLGSVINATLTRTNTTFSFTSTTYTFIANATTMTLTVNAPSMASTCGMVVDDIILELVSALPVTLVAFEAEAAPDGVIDLYWKTASEKQALDFEIRMSRDGKLWEQIAVVPATGSSSAGAEYMVSYTDYVSELLYFRLVQRDENDVERDYGIRSVKRELGAQYAYPNPFSASVTISGTHTRPVVRTALGRDVSSRCRFLFSENGVCIDTQNLVPGVYLVETGKNTFRAVKY